MSDIYNKNAREAHLMAEAYDSIYKEGSFYGRDDLVKKNKEEDKARGAVTLELRDSAGTQRATLPKGDPKIKELLKKGYRKIEDNEDKDFRDEQKDQDPHRHKGLSDFDAEQRDQDPHRHDEDNEYETEADAYRDMSDKYKAEDSIKVGNIYKGESYHELVVGVKGDEVFTKKITLEDGNRYDANRMLDEVKLAGKLNIDFLNEVL